MSKENSSNLLRGLICVAIGAIIWFIPAPAGVGPQAWGLLAVFVATIAGFILQPLPLGAIAIIACALLPVLGIMKAGQALEGFSNGTIWLIVSAFMFATGFIKTGLGKRIAYLLLSRFGKNTLSVAYVMSAADFIIAPFTPSNTARGGGIIYPIVNSVSLALGCDAKSGKNKRTGAFLMYSAYAAVITSAYIFMTGASNNVLANTLTEQAFGQSLSWMSWFEVSIIPGLLLSMGITFPLSNFFVALCFGALIGLVIGAIVIIIRKVVPDGVAVGGTDVMMGAGNACGRYLAPLIVVAACSYNVWAGIGAIIGSAIFYKWGKEMTGGAILGAMILGAIFIH